MIAFKIHLLSYLPVCLGCLLFRTLAQTIYTIEQHENSIAKRKTFFIDPSQCRETHTHRHQKRKYCAGFDRVSSVFFYYCDSLPKANIRMRKCRERKLLCFQRQHFTFLFLDHYMIQWAVSLIGHIIRFANKNISLCFWFIKFQSYVFGLDLPKSKKKKK